MTSEIGRVEPDMPHVFNNAKAVQIASMSGICRCADICQANHVQEGGPPELLPASGGGGVGTGQGGVFIGASSPTHHAFCLLCFCAPGPPCLLARTPKPRFPALFDRGFGPAGRPAGTQCMVLPAESLCFEVCRGRR